MSWTKISILHSQGRNAPGCRSLPLRPSSLPFPLSVLAWIVSKMNQTRSCALKRPTLAELQYVWDDNCRNGSQCLLFTSLELAGSGLEGGISCLCCCRCCCCSCCCCCCCCCSCCCCGRCQCCCCQCCWCPCRKLFPSKFNSGSSFIFFSNFCATRWPWRFLRSWVSLSLSLSLPLSLSLSLSYCAVWERKKERKVCFQPNATALLLPMLLLLQLLLQMLLSRLLCAELWKDNDCKKTTLVSFVAAKN